MHDLLTELTRRPPLFESFDTASLWTDPHVAEVMLQLHLDNTSLLASRPFGDIDAMVAWLSRDIEIDGRHLLDLGCGPGLYSERFQQLGAKVTGMDISERSIAYARDRGIPDAEFILGSYHEAELPECSIATLIYGDICAMPEARRAALFRLIHACLDQDGILILDCFSPSAMADRQDELVLAKDLDGGFWAPSPYFGFKQTFVYREHTTVLDKYLIVEADRMRWVHNWLQHMTPEQLSEELREQGFRVSEAKGVTTGEPWAEDEGMFCLLAQKS